MAIGKKTSKKTMRPARRPKKTKTKKKGVSLWVVFVLASIVFLGYFWARENLVPLMVRSHTTTLGHIERALKAEAYVMRDEVTFAAPASGTLLLKVKEGERVRSGVPVIEISDPATARAQLEQVALATERLLEFDRSNGSEMTSLEKTVTDLDDKIVGVVSEARRVRISGDWERLELLDGSLREYTDQRATAIAGLDRILELRNEMLLERDRLSTIAKDAQTVVNAPGPGVVSFLLDGLESAFSPVSSGGLSARSLFTAQPKPESTRAGDEIKAGKPVFRIVSLDEAYLALPLKAGDLGDVADAQTFKLRSETFGQRSVAARVMSVGDPDRDGFGVAVLSLEPCPEEILSVRRLEVELVKEHIEGIEIPQKCVFEKDGQLGVYVIYKTMVQFKKVKVIDQDGGRAIVDGLDPGVEVIENHWLVKEGLKVRK